MQTYRSFITSMVIAVAALVMLTVLPFLFSSGELQQYYISESGPIQILSAAGYLVVVVTLLRSMSCAQLAKSWPLVFIPLVMCLREMDFHALFTTYSITKTTLYVSPDVPLIQKIFGVTVFVVLGIAAVVLIKQHLADFIRGLKNLNPIAIAVLAGMGSAVLSKVLDGAASNLAMLGINIEPTYLSVVLEEVLEFGIPVFFALAVFAAFPVQTASEKD